MKNILPILLLAAIAACISACNQPPSTGEAGADSGLSSEVVVDLARQAYIFGYPIVVMDATRRAFTNVEAPGPDHGNAPVNQFGNHRTFPDASFKNVVKPNCDTYYSTAWLDLKAEPMVLSVPNTEGRYYLLPMMDAYTNVFASPGKRTTGTEAGNFLITGPAYQGPVPDGMTEIKAPTSMVWIIGRTQVNSAEDGATAVARIQDGYKLTPLSKFGMDYVPEKNKIDSTLGATPPPAVVENMDVETFFNKLNQLMADNPPAPADSSLMNKIAAIGIGPGKQFSLAGFDEATQQALRELPAAAHRQIRENSQAFGNMENGWSVRRTGMGSYGTDYPLRAAIALLGLGANLNEDASYPNCQADENGQPLTGANKYVIHFEKGQTPPANAFWSITMYGPDDFLVANPINRYAIGDRDKLTYNADGSLDIYVQQEDPGPAKRSNWLPADAGMFTLTMRIYWPKEEFFDGSWKIPPVKIAG